MPPQSTRRVFLQGTTSTAASWLVLRNSRLAFGYEASDRLNIAAVGVAGMGAGNVGNVSSQNIVALCDVHESRAAKTFDKHPRAKQYTDYRRLLDEMDKDIDAVVRVLPAA